VIIGLGDRLRATGTFKNNAVPPQLVDPTGITVTINGPGSSVVTYAYPTDAQIVRDTTGVYHTDFNATAAGRWWIEWGSTGGVVASGSLNFLVNQGG
jgi:hypothetical protein